MRPPDKTGIKKNNLLKVLFPRPSNFTEDAFNWESSKPPGLLMIETVSTSIGTAPNRFEPQDTLELGIEDTVKKRRRPTA